VGLKLRNAVAEVERETHPVPARSIHASQRVDVLDGHPVLDLKVDKEHVDDTAAAKRLLAGQVQEDRRVLSSRAGDAHAVEVVEHEGNPLAGGLQN
jgi:tRNA (Thr-GGU) A37 N-methylase